MLSYFDKKQAQLRGIYGFQAKKSIRTRKRCLRIDYSPVQG
jgi:hypothetical protein